jgi:shikimate kinase
VRNIVLIGFMGTGKSVVGRRLAADLGWPFYDTDLLVESRAGMRVQEIFQKHGEAVFRKLEREAVRQVSKEEGCVISTGGGVVTDEENIRDLTEKGELICLTASAETLLKRIERRPNARPLLAGGNSLERVKALLEERRQFYAQASFTLDTTYLSVEKIVEAILRRMKSLHE